MHTVTLLGVSIDAVTMPQAIERLRAFVETASFHHVMTPNSEMLVEASRNPAFRSVLQNASLRIPDSIGLVKMARHTGQHLPERVTGIDTVTAFLSDLPSQHGVFLLGSAPGIAEAAAVALQNKNPGLRVVGIFSGSPREADAPEILRRINAAEPHVLLVAFGSPAQDLWIDRYKQDLHSVRLAMGIGGAFDFLSGKAKRAPNAFRMLGLEWLWRVMREPTRIKRIWNAVVVFPLLVRRFGRNNPV
ncbi:WecB/TagA/CpsF family glycosyltransferase [Candidatus Peregrinibacteria bacterium]|nr:WecB/TagA/CpsF family glycosyltransferase [Candidatus Peregrinibacteria bacterium]